MDPLSVTASIIAVLQLTTSLASYLTGVRSATPEQRKLAVEVSHLSSLLTSLRFRVEDASAGDEWFEHVKLLGNKDGPLKQLEAVLEKLINHTNISNSSRKREQLRSALLWKFTKPDVDAALGQMERLKSLIQIALSNDVLYVVSRARRLGTDCNSKLSQVIHSELTEIGDTIWEMQDTVERLQIHTDRDLQVKLSNWLKLPDPSTNYHAALKRRHPGTGSWLLTGQEFRNWKSSKSSLCWLHGKPGCGKTVLSATAVENVLTTTLQSRAVVGYFYFDFNDTNKQSWSIAMRSLLFQLSLQSPTRLQALEQLYQACDNGQRQPTDERIYALLVGIIEHTNVAYIVLDALVECLGQDELFMAMNSLMASRQFNLCILATSRRERDIDASLRSIADHVIDIGSALVDTDINDYIRGRLDTDWKLRKWPIAVKEEITNALMEKANGMFRWVHCQLEVLRKCCQRGVLRKALSDLPKDLDGTYGRILQGIESNGNLSYAITVLRWLCFSYRPLTLSELVEVLAIENNDDGSGIFDPAERMPDPDDIMEICSGLISYHDKPLRDTQRDSIDESAVSYLSSGNRALREAGLGSNGTVEIRLAHFSVKEYLLSDRCFGKLDFLPERCDTAISWSCLHYLRYLGEKSMLINAVVDKYPLANYAARYWWWHAQKAVRFPVTKRITNGLISDFLTSDFMTSEPVLLTLPPLYDVGRSLNARELLKVKDRFALPLFWAACCGFLEVAQDMITRGANIDLHGYIALYAASLHGHEKVVQTLIDAGADINAPGAFFDTRSLVYIASRYGNEEVVRVLIEARAYVNTIEGKPPDRSTALLVALAFHHENVAKLLIEAGADVNAGGSDEIGVPLLYALEDGLEQIVQLLVEGGADFPTPDRQQYLHSTVYTASKMGFEKVLKLLVDMGADVNTPGGLHGKDTALFVASYGEHEKVVQLLIDAGADVNALGDTDGNHVPLYVAIYNRNEKIVKLLIDAGANVKTSQGFDENETALSMAKFYASKEIVQMVIDAGAAVDGSYETG